MTVEGPEWKPTFDSVNKEPPSTKPKKRLTEKDLQDRNQEINRRNAANIAVSMGAVDTGDDFDPFSAINDQFNAGGASTADLRRETGQIAAGLAQLQADVAANNNSGKSFIVTVSDYDILMPDVFTVVSDTGAGAIYNDGNSLQMDAASGRELLGYNVEQLATDYFEVSLICPRLPNSGEEIYFLGRGDADWNNYVFARLNWSTLRVGAVIAGVSTLDSPIWFGSRVAGTGPEAVTINPGVYMTFSGGTFAGARSFQFKVNNQLRAQFLDTGNVSQLGEDYRWTGCGITNNGGASPSFSHFMANDNAPAEIVGSVATLVRLSSTQWGVSSGTNILGGGFFDAVEEVSTDMLPGLNLAAGTVTIPKSRRYVISAQARCGTSWPNHFHFVLFRNGSAFKHFGPDHMYGSNALGGTISPECVGATWSGYLYEGDVIRLGYDSDASFANGLRGESTGRQTYFTVGAG